VLRRRLAGLPAPEGAPGAAGPGGRPGGTGPGASAGPAGRPHLVFFQHDEVIVHSPAGLAGAVEREVAASGEEAARLVFGPTQVRFPLNMAVVGCYADAKRPVPAPDPADGRSRPNKIGPVDAPSDAI
jgi:hypothetical protein